MAAQPTPRVKKTKKSSYKPLSKLNEDNLTDLTRLDKPEYTSRVFYYNIASRARLGHDVNVWFRDHQHSIALLQRQQRAVQQTMCRMQKHVHRTRRDEYKRRQKEIREKLNALQTRLLQRRIVQKFESNAMSMMAAKGEQSLTELRLMRQTRPHDTGVSMSDDKSAVDKNYRRGSKPFDNPQNHKTDLLKDQSQSGDTISTSPERSAKKDIDIEVTHDSNSKPKPPTQTHKTKSTRRYSEGDVRQMQDVNALDIYTHMTHSSPKSDTIATNLDIIPEDTSPMDAYRPDDILEDNYSNIQDQTESAKEVTNKNSSSKSSRVLEVRKNRPGSPKTRTVTRARRATLPQTSKLKALAPITTYTSQTSPIDNEVTSDQRRPSLGSNTVPFSSLPNPRQRMDSETKSYFDDIKPSGIDTPSKSCKQNSDKDFKRSASSERDCQESVTGGKVSEKCREGKVSKASSGDKEPEKDKGPNVEPSAGHVVFSKVPTREEVLEDAVMFLDLDEEEPVAKSQRQGGHSLAARLRKQRKRQAKRRSELLDKEPLVQYYRSVRGTLEPLLTKPSRRSFPFPSGRPQYDQNKMLREEQQKDIERRQDINTFFNDLFQKQQTGQTPKPAEQGNANSNKGASPAKHNQLDVLLNMQRRSHQLATSVRRNSIQQLATCQYLRVYDWDANRKNKRDKEPVMTSWAAAENRLKAGFLAMNFTD